MAKLINGLFGTVSGKIGDKVAVNSKRGNYFRALPKKSTKPPTAAQLLQREKLKRMAVFLKPFRELTDRFFGEKELGKTRSELAMSYNLKEALDVVGDQVAICYSKVLLTKGYLTSIQIKKIQKQKRGLNLQWESPKSGLAKETDWLNLVLYIPKTHSFHFLEHVAQRGTKKYTTILPESFEHDECVMWIFVTNERDSMCSTSAYLGTF